jgi:hypothetical protein
MTDTATRVVLSYPADLSEWGRYQLTTRHFEAYLRKTLGTVHEGDRREEFLDVGCCGDALDLTLRVAEVEGGTEVDTDTEIAWTEHEACDVQGGWRVQSADGPTA